VQVQEMLHTSSLSNRASIRIFPSSGSESKLSIKPCG